MGTLRELVELGAAGPVYVPVYVWGAVHVVDGLLRIWEMRIILRRTPDDQIASVVRALNASRRSAK